jgi:hypothetical protein
MTNAYTQQASLLITNKQLIEAIASMSTDLAAKNIQASEISRKTLSG